MECTVHTPCGQYTVHFACKEKQLRLDVYPKAPTSDKPAAGTSTRYFSTTLNEEQIMELTTAAGVRKGFKSFVEMAYHALIGSSACVKFYVETCEEMKRRISSDVARCTEQRDRLDIPNNTTLNTVDLSLQSDVADDVLSQRFLTIDYDVDFTRAVFPLPLVVIDAAAFVATIKPGAATSPAASVVSPCTDAKHSELSHERFEQLAAQLRAAEQRAELLSSENAKLRRENSALVRLSKEKMIEMQRLCEDFESRVHTSIEADKWKEKNTTLRMKLHAVEAERDDALRALEMVRSHRPPTGPDAGGLQVTSTRSRQHRHRLRSPSTEGSQRTVHRDTSSRSRRTVASPNNIHKPRAGSRAGPVATMKFASRFDTPPNSQGGILRRGSRSFERNGGDSPAPRGRTGGRPNPTQRQSPSHHPVSSSASPKCARKYLWSDRGSQCSSVASSRCSSASHERLYRTPTASSRLHQRQSPLLFDRHTPGHRAVFR